MNVELAFDRSKRGSGLGDVSILCVESIVVVEAAGITALGE